MDTLGEVAGEIGQMPRPLTLFAVGTGNGGVCHASREMRILDTLLLPHGGVALGAGLSRSDDVRDQTVLAEYVSTGHALRVPRDLSAEATEQLDRIDKVARIVAPELSPGIPRQNHRREYIVPACVHLQCD